MSHRSDNMDDPAQLLPSEISALVDLLKCAAQRVGTGSHVKLLSEINTLSRNTLDNLRAPDALTELPVEVLVHILSFLPFHSLVRVSATSRALRCVILEEAILWKTVVASSSSQNSALPLFLERGRSVPVSLDIVVNRPQSDLVELITSNTWRLSSLVISTRLPQEDFHALRLLPVAIARPATQLRYFELRLGYTEVRGPLFASHAPLLEHLWLGADLRPNFSAFPALRVVVLSSRFAHSFRHAWAVLRSCRALEHAAIRVFHSVADEIDTRPLPPLLALRSLRLRVDPADEDISAGEAEFLLRVVRPDVRARIDLTLMPFVVRNDVPLGAEVLYVGRHPGDTPRFNIHARGTGRPTRTFRGANLANARVTVKEQLAFSAGRLLMLTLPSSLLTTFAFPEGLTFPQLHTYTVSLRQRDGDFLGGNLPFAHMPELRTLVLRREIAPASWSPDVDVDADALRGCPRIARLVLQGVRVEGDVQPYFQEVVSEPWQYDDQPVFDRMDWWVFDDSLL